ncbi:hypothetical protein CBOM_02614 [Ceraceosorus bombacis]|uniref:Uncharacterized protein n=1 Tax=Ceraceosorus bombacis TaxID=401625 RepID=A0A0P1BFR1_9BASI|nr:hypothetical protein CBOM_02614 [Ceraceosorus bombacis]
MDFLITDLDWHRLDPTWRPSEHPFEDVKMWHLEQSVSTDDGIVDDLQEMAIDATTIYTTRKSAGLHFVDFGIAASMKAAKEDKLRLHAGAGSNFDSPWREAARI